MTALENPDCMLPEHPAATIVRLKRSGYWKDAEKLLRRVKRRYRHKFGKSGAQMTMAERIEMTEAAWLEVLAKYPYPEDATPASVAEYLTEGTSTPACNWLTQEAADRFESLPESEDLTQEAIWVHHNLDNKKATALECPSRGAWSMLREARKNRTWFYDKVYVPIAKAMARRKPEQGGDDYMPSAEERKAQAELEDLLAQAVAESQATHCN